MADEVIDSLQIKVTADTKDAESKISKLSETLAKLKVGSLSKTAADKLKAISDAAKGVDGESANKVEKLASAISKLSAAKIPASLANQISKIGTALKSIDNSDMAKLKDLTDSIGAINASGGVGNIKVQMPKVDKSAGKPQVQNLSDAIPSVDKQINLQVDTTQIERATELVNYLSDAITRTSGKQLMPPKTDTSGFEDVRNAIEGSVESMGVFQTTGRVVDVEIQNIGNSASKSSTGIKALITALRGIDSAYKGMGAVSKGIWNSFTGAISNAKKSADNFLSSITRIAKYRLIRSALKAITQGFREGLQNAYQWSKLNGGQFAKSMDSLATSALYLKNAFASIAAPLVNALAPAFEYIVDKIVEAINWFNRFIAFLSGKSTYMKATRSATEYAAATDKATKANQKFKASILGIDEINPLNDNSASGGAGGGAGGANYSDMFEEAQVGEMPEFLGQLKMTFTDILVDWKDANEEQKAEKIEAVLFGLLGGITGIVFSGSLAGGIVGAIAGVGLGILFDTVVFDHDGTLSKEEVLTMVITAVMGLIGGIAGFTITKSAKGALVGTWAGAGLGLLFSKLTFDNDGSLSKEEVWSMVIQVIGAMIGAATGIAFGKGTKGAMVGTIAGSSLGVLFSKLTFDGDGKLSKEETWSMIISAIGAIVGAGVGIAFTKSPKGALVGSIIGSTLGVLFSKLTFNGDGNISKDEVVQMIVSAITTIVGAIVGLVFTKNPKGALIGASVGGALGLLFNKLTFDNDGTMSKEETAKSIVSVVAGFIGAIAGVVVTGSPQGAMLGFTVGSLLGLGFNKLTFDGDGVISDTEVGKMVVGVLLTLIGGAVGAIVAGPVGALVGVTVGALLSLAFSKVDIESKAKDSAKSGFLGKLWNFLGIHWDEGSNTASVDAESLDVNPKKTNLNVKKEDSEGWWTKIVNLFNGGEGKQRKLEVGATNTTKKDDTNSWWTRIKDTLWGTKNLPVGASNTTKKADTNSWWTRLKEKLWGTKNLSVGAKMAVTKTQVKDWVKSIQNTWNQTGARLEIAVNGKLKKISVPSELNTKLSAINGVRIEYTSATGGLYDQGDVILAREAGPEMIGRIGNKTAVVNNDQIVDSVASGVAAANQEQNALLRQQNELLRQQNELLAKQGGGGQVTVSTILTGVDRYNRRAGKTVVATA